MTLVNAARNGSNVLGRLLRPFQPGCHDVKIGQHKLALCVADRLPGRREIASLLQFSDKIDRNCLGGFVGCAADCQDDEFPVVEKHIHLVDSRDEEGRFAQSGYIFHALAKGCPRCIGCLCAPAASIAGAQP